jgi:hypothetical protein
MAVNIEIGMPMLMVMAKPRMAPVPIANRISILIRLGIRVDDRAVARRIQPRGAEITPLVLRASSRARSLMRMLASTAMPRARRMPAIPEA